MADPRPMDGDDPYEKLGVDRTKNKGNILAEANKVIKSKEIEVKNLRGAEDSDYKSAARELSKMKDALEELKNNHPDDGHPDPVDLSLSLVSDDPTVGKPVTFRVTGDGGPEKGITVSSDSGHSSPTDSKGEVTFTFDKANTFEIRANGEFHHQPDALDVSISPRTISLKIATAPAELEAGEQGDIRVTDQDGIGVERVPILSGSDQIGRTGNSGVATVSFDTAGTHEIEATASDNNDIRYSSDKTTIDVVPTKIPLNLQVSKGGIETNEKISFRVVDDDQIGVKGATVRVKDGPKDITDSGGEAELEFKKPGPRQVNVSKSVDDDSVSYEGDSVTLEVGKGTSALRIGETDGEFSEHSSVRIKVVDHNGFAIEGAEISTNHGHELTTNKDGWAELDIDSNEELTVNVTKKSEKLDYEPVERTYSIDEYKGSIVFDGLPNIASQNDMHTVQVVDENGNAVEGARIHSTRQREEVWTTDSDGYAQIQTMDSSGAEKFTADKPDVEFEDIAEHRIIVQ